MFVEYMFVELYTMFLRGDVLGKGILRYSNVNERNIFTPMF